MDTTDATNATNTTNTTDSTNTKGTVDVANSPQIQEIMDEKYPLIAGVFRERADAEQGMEALKQAGMEDVHLSEYDPTGGAEAAEATEATEATEPSPGSSDRRYIVQVQAEGREQEAVGLLTGHGANNSDLPPGTSLVRGNIVPRSGAKTENAKTSSVAGASAESFFESAKAADHPLDVRVSDNTSAPGI